MEQFNAQTFAEAVLVQYSEQADRAVRTRAQAYINGFTESESGWQFILRVFPSCTDGRVRFTLLNALNGWIGNRWSAVPPAGRQQLIQMLMAWCAQHLPSATEDVNVVRPKVAQTLTLLFIAEYPAGWPTFFDDHLRLLSRHPLHIDMFLRILDTIDELVVSTDYPRTPAEISRNGRLKDAMRASAIPGIVKAWYEILTSCVQSHPKLVALTLHVMKKYAPWIDIQFFNTPQFPPMMSAFLASEKFQKEAAKLVASITGKGMPPIDKLELIRRFSLLEMCRSARPVKDTRFAEHIARWINELGVHVLDGLAALREAAAQPEQSAQAQGMLDTCVRLMLSCLKQLHTDAAIEVIDFANRYLSYLKSSGDTRPESQAALRELLQCIPRLLMFDPEFQLPSQMVVGEIDEDTVELEDWLEQRDKLAQLFRAVGRLQSSLCSALVRNMAERTFPQHARLHWTQVEVVLYLMIVLGDVLVQDGSSELKNQFRPFLALMLQHDLASNSHFMIVKTSFDVILRFFRYVPDDERTLLLLLQLTELRGIRHAHPAVRKRAMNFFNRLAQRSGHALVGILPRLLPSVQGLLWPISGRVQDNGYFLFQMTLYETLGLLVGQNADDASHSSQVETIMGPVAGELRRLAQAPSAAAVNMSQMQMCLAACRLVEAAASFSKGFSGLVQRPNSRAKDVFVGIFGTVMALRRKRLGDEELQSKCLQFMHRMVEVLQHEFLQSLDAIVQMLLVEGGVPGAQDFMKLMGQLVSRFGSSMQRFLSAILAPLTRKVFDFVAQGEAELQRQASVSGQAVALSELGREVRELRTCYYMFLLTVCRNQELAAVLTLPEHSAVLEAVLKALKSGTLWWGQPREQREVWLVLLLLLEAWGPRVAGFRAWFLQEIVPVLLQSPWSDVFPLEQGQYVQTLRQMCQVQHSCFTVLKEDFVRVLGSQLVAAGCDEATRNQYLALLSGTDREAFIEFYMALLRRARKARTPRK